ncbi:MAG: sulfite exporter TauE/SafE family protein [Chitinophagaceae bacterium]|nr:sulfite exporter TauE/SafE family protein [Chitinophagaceae bacterium]
MDIQAFIILILIGLAAGILSGLVGVGGGIILVPALVYFLNYNQHQAQGTSLGVLTFPVTILAFLTYYKDCMALGTPIEFKVIGVIAIAFIVGGLIGSKTAVRFDQETLRKMFAVILFYTGIKMLHWDDAAIKWIKNIFS